MKRAVLALLRFLLQLLIFAMTGSWPRLQGLESRERAPTSRAKRPKQPKQAKRAGPSRATPRSPASAPMYVDAWRGAEGQTSLEAIYGGLEGGVPSARIARRTRGRPDGAKPHDETVADVLRSRAGLRDAIVLGAGLGPRRTRR